MNYDGTTNLNDGLAKLYKCSVGDRSKISGLRTEAKAALGINARTLSQTERLSVYHWHCQKLNVVEHRSQASAVENIQQAVAETVEHIQQPVIDAVENNSQPINQPVENVSQHYDPYKLARVAFYTGIDGIKKRQVVALHGFMLNALMAAVGISVKAGVPKWLTSQSFAGGKSITLQVQQLITQALIGRLKNGQ